MRSSMQLCRILEHLWGLATMRCQMLPVERLRFILKTSQYSYNVGNNILPVLSCILMKKVGDDWLKPRQVRDTTYNINCVTYNLIYKTTPNGMKMPFPSALKRYHHSTMALPDYKIIEGSAYQPHKTATAFWL